MFRFFFFFFGHDVHVNVEEFVVPSRKRDRSQLKPRPADAEVIDLTDDSVIDAHDTQSEPNSSDEDVDYMDEDGNERLYGFSGEDYEDEEDEEEDEEGIEKIDTKE